MSLLGSSQFTAILWFVVDVLCLPCRFAPLKRYMACKVVAHLLLLSILVGALVDVLRRNGPRAISFILMINV